MNLHYCLMVTGPAYGNQRASSALQFSWALLECNHYIDAIFFYQDGVYNANRLSTPASDEVDLVRAWEKLALQHKIALYTCVSAALRRGVIDVEQAAVFQKNGDNLQLGFQLRGLGSFMKVVLRCDRFVQF